MALRFYFDTHVAKAAVTQLREKGIEVVRCEEIRMAEASDEEHLHYATENGYVMVSQDEDFIILHVRWQRAERSHAGIMKVSARYQGEAQISYVVRQILFYHQAERLAAVDYATEIANHLLYL